MSIVDALEAHQRRLRRCRSCPQMQPPVVIGLPVVSPVLMIGQAPGDREGPAGKPFAWTAGKTLFKWFESIGLDENGFRSRIYMAAVCRCFPGKKATGGDRVPSRQEIDNCQHWLTAEIDLLQPQLLVPVGKLAIGRFLGADRLASVIGHVHRVPIQDRELDLIPLPHPSGASTWHRTEPGKTLLHDALQLIAGHPAWEQIVDDR